MESGSLDLRSLVDGLTADELDELRDAVASRLCREKYGADTIEGLLLKWGRDPSCPACGASVAWSDGSNGARPRFRCPACGSRFGLLTGTVFANAKLPLHKIMRIVEVMCHNASLRLIELTCEVSHSTAFLWRHKVFSTVSGWQDHVVLSGRVWIDEMYFEDTRVERDPGAPRRRGLSKDKVCVVVAIDSFKQAMAVVSENGKPSTKRINGALKTHIRRGSTIVHDCEKAHNALVRELALVDERYKAVTTDPTYLEQMALVNHLCSWIRRYVERFSCMKSDNLQAYLDWFVYLHRVHRDEEKWPVEERVVRHLALSNGTYLRRW
ncbi:MAG: IS1595 family transposase [Atopobiaceae bacterium]|nr:IS1595 family transposase [Atopobiaceae bacterium]